MRVELTGAERARLQALLDELPTRGPGRLVRADVVTRSRHVQDAIARAHGLHPADTRFCTDSLTGSLWIEVRPHGAARRALEVARFAEDVDGFAVHELEVDIERRAAIRLAGKLSQGGPVLVGERHGVEQNPLVIHTLMRHLGLRVIALEWPADLQPALDAFLAGGPLDADAFAGGADTCEDGRVTAGHLAVLRALRRDGLLDRVILFDFAPWPRTWSERDRGMAVRLLEGIAGAPPALVVTGSLHARLRRHRHGEPMGAHVARARSGTVEMRLRCPGRLAGNGPCLVRSAGAWLEMTVPGARPATAA